jgi:hypothetical protein
MSTNQTIKTQLNQIKSKIVKTPNGLKTPSASPMKWLEDGVDHININGDSVTELGKFLSHNSPNSFFHSLFGSFATMESFWFYIHSDERDDRLRVMSGRVLKKFSKNLTIKKISNFRAIILDANWQRIQQYPPIITALKESTLPFDCYRYLDDTSLVRVRPTFFKWLIKGFEEIRLAVKEDREPNFTFLLDKYDSNIYDFVLPKKPPINTVIADSENLEEHY